VLLKNALTVTAHVVSGTTGTPRAQSAQAIELGRPGISFLLIEWIGLEACYPRQETVSLRSM